MRERLSLATLVLGQTLRAPNLRRALLSFGAAWASEWGVVVAVAILAFRTGGAAAVGIVGMVRMLPAALLAPVAAVLVDRHRRERVLSGLALARGAALGSAALVVELQSSPLPAYALIATATIAHTLYRPAHSALLPSLCTTGAELTSANVARGLFDALSAMVGPLVAGALIGPIGVAGVFAVCAVAAAWSGWLIGRVRYEAPPRIVDAARPHAAREAIEGVGILARRPDARVLTILGCLQTFTRGCFGVFSVVVALQLLRLPESGVGILTGGFGAGAVLGSLALSLLVGRPGFGRWYAAAICAWGIPFVALGATSSEIVAIALLAVVGVANSVADVAKSTLMQWLVPDELMGRVFASNEALVTLAAAAGSLATPALIALLGIRGALVAAGLVAPIAAPLAFVRLRRIDAQLHVSAEVVTLLQRVAMLRPLPLATITRLAAEASRHSASAGSVVIREGMAGDDFYVIVDGRAGVVVDGVTVGHLGPAECFGEIAALRGIRRTSSVRADTELRLLRFSAPHFVRAVSGYSPSSAASAALVHQRLGRAMSSTVAGGATVADKR